MHIAFFRFRWGGPGGHKTQKNARTASLAWAPTHTKTRAGVGAAIFYSCAPRQHCYRGGFGGFLLG